VSVRVRPLNKQEQSDGFAWRSDGNSLVQIDPTTREPVERGRDATRYALDNVFGPEATTSDIYRATTQPLIHKLVHGFNATVFAYGQTSSGKTFTMRGAGAEAPGIIPLAVSEVFALIEATADREFLLRVSYMEARVGGVLGLGGGVLETRRFFYQANKHSNLFIINTPPLTNLPPKHHRQQQPNSCTTRRSTTCSRPTPCACPSTSRASRACTWPACARTS
jgi:hypothetical protein